MEAVSDALGLAFENPSASETADTRILHYRLIDLKKQVPRSMQIAHRSGHFSVWIFK
jgi:hypothetical protein